MLKRWSRLGKMQVGLLGEQVASQQLAMLGFEVLTPQVDDRGTDLVVRSPNRVLDVQVKCLRSIDEPYLYVRKSIWTPSPERLLVVVLLKEDEDPRVLLIPFMLWATPDDLFLSRDYVGKKSAPEWGLRLSPRNLERLECFDVRSESPGWAGALGLEPGAPD